MDLETHYRKLERMYQSAPFNDLYKPRLTVSEGAAYLEYDIKPVYYHAAGAVHGAVYMKMIDDAAFFAANSLETEFFIVTVSLTTYLTRPVSEGMMICRAGVTHASRRLILAEAVVEDDQGRQIGRGNGSFMKSRVPLSEEIGYV